MKTLSLCKKLFFTAHSALSKLNAATIEGLCGPGVYYGTVIAGVISLKGTKIDRAESVTCPGQPAAHTVA
jgi:hypothetical protein